MHKITDTGSYYKVVMVGRVTFEDILAAIDDTMSQPDYIHRNDVWVFGHDALEVLYGELEQITDHILQGYPAEITRTKSAIVVPPGMNAAIVEMWHESSGRLPVPVELFDNLAAAEAWIIAE